MHWRMSRDVRIGWQLLKHWESSKTILEGYIEDWGTKVCHIVSFFMGLQIRGVEVYHKGFC